VLVIVDCISTFGIVPLDLRGVYMASASSGKAIGSYAGLAMVFYNRLQEGSQVIPVYLDIFQYIKKNGIPFTLNSNALFALGEAVKTCNIELKYQKLIRQTRWLKEQLLKTSLKVVSLGTGYSHPAITTINLPVCTNSVMIGDALEAKNILINYRSDYLIRHNMIQICLFSEIDDEDLKDAITQLITSSNCQQTLMK
jgi:aspartate aminotransferase-like enzyme